MKGIDPEKAVQELERIENIFGKITPEIIVNASRPTDSPLHQYFNWDDEKAAEQWRMQQARILLNNIEVEIISGGGQKEYMAVYEVGVQSTYKHIATLDKTDIETVKANIKAEIMYWQTKLKRYQNFDKVIQALNAAMGEIENIS